MRIPFAIADVRPPRGIDTPVDTRPLEPTATGTLRLRMPDADGRSFVSAASGIAAAGGAAWAVSDEYGELARFDRLREPGALLPGLPRAGSKPDLEAIVRLPGCDADRGAMLLALGSGSSPDRNRGVAQQTDARGRAVGAPRVVDLRGLYAELDARLPLQPNVEGAAWVDGARGAELLLLHRAKVARDVNTIFRLDGAAVLQALRSGGPIPASALRAQVGIDLGTLGGERLGFADARTLPDGRVVFVASAEGSQATGDGPIRGSVIGMLDPDLRVTALRPLAGPPRKVEGIEIARELDASAPADRFVLVTDPDEPSHPTELLTVDML